jgi:hypothetical protein
MITAMKFMPGRVNWKAGLEQFLLTSLGVKIVVESAYIEMCLQERRKRIRGNTCGVLT